MSLSERTASAVKTSKLLTAAALSSAQRNSRRMIFWVTFVIMAFFTVYGGFIPETIGGVRLTIMQRALTGEPFSIIALVSVYGIGALTLIGLALGRVSLSAFGPPLMWLGSGVLLSIAVGYTYTSNALSAASLLVISGLLLGTRGLIGGYIAALVAAAIALSRREALGAVTGAEFATLVNLTLQYSGLTLLIYLYNRVSQAQTAETARRASADQARLIAIAGGIA
ncbi:MAG: hypothetical protein CUN53_05805, partial [Phototrophicales bacterium]